MLRPIIDGIWKMMHAKLGGKKGGGAPAGPYSESTSRRVVLSPNNGLCAITDVGRVRGHNEDAFYVSDDGTVWIVADGMGGHEAGEVASALAIEAIRAFFLQRHELNADDDSDSVERLLVESLEAAQRKVLEASQGHETDRQMGCTILIGCLRGDQLYTCHAGDVRCYVWSGTELQALTRDHSVVATLVAGGQLTADQARVHPQKNEVLQAIGMPYGIVPDVNSRVLQAGDRVLLCSDGLWEALSDREIAAVVGSDGTMRQLATQLVNRANAAGGPDNITVVLYEHQPVEVKQ
jgi:serine/threonine protein phosphatase PrpC